KEYDGHQNRKLSIGSIKTTKLGHLHGSFDAVDNSTHSEKVGFYHYVMKQVEQGSCQRYLGKQPQPCYHKTYMTNDQVREHPSHVRFHDSPQCSGDKGSYGDIRKRIHRKVVGNKYQRKYTEQSINTHFGQKPSENRSYGGRRRMIRRRKPVIKWKDR